MQRKWVIGDIRGELNLLIDLMNKIGPTKSDQVIFTGSYLGPGPNSKGVVDYIIGLYKVLPNLAFLRGCYEYMFGFCIETKPADEMLQIWGAMKGLKVFESYVSDEKLVIVKSGNNGKPSPVQTEVPLRIPASHIEFFSRLHQWFEDDVYPYVVCHSGGHPTLYGGAIPDELHTVFAENGWWEQDGRRIPGKTVIFSHYPFSKPFRRPGKLGIDLGAGFGGKLCSFEFFEEKFYIVG